MQLHALPALPGRCKASEHMRSCAPALPFNTARPLPLLGVRGGNLRYMQQVLVEDCVPVKGGVMGRVARNAALEIRMVGREGWASR